MGSLIKTQFWLFKKQKINIIILLAFLAAGMYGLYQGFAFKHKQVKTIEAFCKEKAADLEKIKKGFQADTSTAEGREAFSKASGLFAANRYLVLAPYKMPPATAIFGIGQSDVFPYYYTVKMESFFMQLFKQGEIANPLRSLAGHFDTSFWIIYLLPLFLIITGFNSLSAEMDNGNWRLISSQNITARQWLRSKLLLIGLLAGILVLFIFSIGLLLNYWQFRQPPSVTDLLFLLAAGLYLVLWLSILYVINAFGKTSGANALSCGIAWILACILIPAIVTTVIEKSIPVDNTLVSRISRRPQGSKFEDPAFGVKTIRQLGESRPAYKTATLTPQNPPFSLAIYLAYHELLDDSNSVAVQNYFTRIERRQQAANASSILNPAGGIDGLFASLTASDAAANHDFVWQTKALHQQLHDMYFPALFFNRQLTKNDYDKIPAFNYQVPGVNKNIIINYFLLFLLAAGLFIAGNRRLSKIG